MATNNNEAAASDGVAIATTNAPGPYDPLASYREHYAEVAHSAIVRDAWDATVDVIQKIAVPIPPSPAVRCFVDRGPATAYWAMSGERAGLFFSADGKVSTGCYALDQIAELFDEITYAQLEAELASWPEAQQALRAMAGERPKSAFLTGLSTVPAPPAEGAASLKELPVPPHSRCVVRWNRYVYPAIKTLTPMREGHRSSYVVMTGDDCMWWKPVHEVDVQELTYAECEAAGWKWLEGWIEGEPAAELTILRDYIGLAEGERAIEFERGRLIVDGPGGRRESRMLLNSVDLAQLRSAGMPDDAEPVEWVKKLIDDRNHFEQAIPKECPITGDPLQHIMEGPDDRVWVATYGTHFRSHPIPTVDLDGDLPDRNFHVQWFDEDEGCWCADEYEATDFYLAKEDELNELWEAEDKLRGVLQAVRGDEGGAKQTRHAPSVFAVGESNRVAEESVATLQQSLQAAEARAVELSRDLEEARRERGSWYASWRKLTEAIVAPRPRCRDCADSDGTCSTDGLPCDPTDLAIEVHRRLQQQLAAEKERAGLAEQLADDAILVAQVAEHDGVNFHEPIGDIVGSIEIRKGTSDNANWLSLPCEYREDEAGWVFPVVTDEIRAALKAGLQETAPGDFSEFEERQAEYQSEYQSALTAAQARIAELERERAGLAERIRGIKCDEPEVDSFSRCYANGFRDALEAAAQLADAKGGGEHD